MTSEEEYTVLFSLLRSGLWERQEDFSAFPANLTAKDWNRVLDLARQQTVTGLIYRGLDYLPDRLLPDTDIMIRLTAEIDRIERLNRRMNEAVLSLFTFFKESGLFPVLLKGQGVGIFYERPLLRVPGDIDLCFTGIAERERAVRLVHEAGLHTEKMPDGSIVYQWQGIEVELHPGLFDLYNPFLMKYQDIPEYEKEYVRLGSDAKSVIAIPSPELNILLLSTHILKHAMGKGIGLRQLCDMARACHTLYHRVYGTGFRWIYNRCGIMRWSRLLHSFLVNDLGMPENDLPYEERFISSGPMRRIILRGGNFGQYRDGDCTENRTGWGRKCRTAVAFLQNLPFSLRYAPGEVLRTIVALTKGQLGL